jgi:hypothetical protein
MNSYGSLPGRMHTGHAVILLDSYAGYESLDTCDALDTMVAPEDLDNRAESLHKWD